MIADKLFISVRFINLKKCHSQLLGRANAETRIIELDESLINRPKLLKCILAEEIGHILFPPRVGHIIYHSKEYWKYNSSDRNNIKALVAQDERLALDWATSILVPDVEFWRIIGEGVNTVWELADFFDVEDWFMCIKINYINRKTGFTKNKLNFKNII
ncbi:MAG: hypothetical protein M1119_11600 [Firmicutes bacterium]|nr:hypothetical protein [Bacillota bacterium]